MPANIEVKLRLTDPETTRKLIYELTQKKPEVLNQCDTFFKCPNGRLKLRIVNEVTSCNEIF